jgi:Ni2+-binding GTPase involved in maturation of urease and hydrogenase
MTPLLMTVGGFLGAGKTTLITAAAQRLVAAGKRVVVITNDQAPDLVDSALVRLAGMPMAEVAGSCFCCAFDDFVARTNELIAAHRPDVILAEPVGSCVDIAATVLRPLAQARGTSLRIAPFSVCVDPAAWRAAAAGQLPAATAYIQRMQVLEADVLLLTKTDIEPAEAVALLAAQLSARNPVAQVQQVSACDGSGLDAWLDTVLSGPDGGQRRISVNYDTYADGEAALGWLNAHLTLQGNVDWTVILSALLVGIAERCAARACPPAHLKCLLESGSLVAIANAVTGRSGPHLRTLRTGICTSEAQLTINARVPMAAADLRALTEAALAELPGVRGQVRTLRAFPPGRPMPTHRLT